jgi:hypothetical protein
MPLIPIIATIAWAVGAIALQFAVHFYMLAEYYAKARKGFYVI